MALPATTKAEMNILLEKNSCRMFLFKDNKVYLLIDHHRYLDPEDAPLMLIGPGGHPAHPHVRISNRNKYHRVIYLTAKI